MKYLFLLALLSCANLSGQNQFFKTYGGANNENQTATMVADFSPTLLTGGSVNSNPFIAKYGSQTTDVCGLVATTTYKESAAFWSISPNPADRFLRINGLQKPATALIVHATGKIMLHTTLVPGQTIDVSDLPVGLYFLQIGGRQASSFLVIR